MGFDINGTIVVVRGGGDLATGVIQKLVRSGFKVVILETKTPLAIRRTVSLCQAVYQSEFTVEDITAERVNDVKACASVFRSGRVPLLIDPDGLSIESLKPAVVVDAILAKRNVGTTLDMADITIGLGPGFVAGQDVDVVVETKRGHDLGKLYFSGSAHENTGIPGEIGGKSNERVIHAKASGPVKHVKQIGDVVNKGETLFYINDEAVISPLTGVLRGLISEDVFCVKGLKCADIDPRKPAEVDCFTISDKARNLGGAVLEAILMCSS